MMICGKCFFCDMINAVPAFRFHFSRVEDALKLPAKSCRYDDGCVSLSQIVSHAAVVSAENSLAFVIPSECRRTILKYG